MERFVVIDDKTKNILLDTAETPGVNAWDFAYQQIKDHPEYEIFIDVYVNGVYSHWVDSESIVSEREVR